MGKKHSDNKLPAPDRYVKVDWEKFKVGYNERYRDIQIVIRDSIGMDFELRLRKRDAVALAERLLDAVDGLDEARDKYT